MNQKIESVGVPDNVVWFTQDTLAKLRIWVMTITGIVFCAGGNIFLILTPEKPVVGIILLYAALFPTFYAVYLNLMRTLSTQTKTYFRRHCVPFMSPLLFLPFHIGFAVWILRLSATEVGSARQSTAIIFAVALLAGYGLSLLLSSANATELD